MPNTLAQTIYVFFFFLHGFSFINFSFLGWHWPFLSLDSMNSSFILQADIQKRDDEKSEQLKESGRTRECSMILRMGRRKIRYW